MPFGCESYVDERETKETISPGRGSPMPFGCESYVDARAGNGLPRLVARVTNAFRL